MSQYLDFVDYKYKPKPGDLVALYKIEPSKKISFNEAAGRVAAESSNGTWTELTTLKPHIRKIRARAFSKSGDLYKIAYPSDLFELGSMPQIYSALAGNIFGMKAVKNLRLLDINFPDKMIRSFKGPQFGLHGVRKFMKVSKRPLTATVPKPKVGMTTSEHAKVGLDSWLGGIDFLKDDENLTNQSFNKFQARAKLCAKMRDRAESQTGEKKDYFINVTAETNEMLKRAKIAKSFDFKYIMCDIVTTGWAGVQSLREFTQDSKQAIHAHRAMHSTFTRDLKHGVTMLTLAKSARLVGVDNIHIGTVVGKLVSPKDEVLELNKAMKSSLSHIKSVIPTSSGGLHPGIVPDVIELLGSDCLLQLGGGIHGHPKGSKAGAAALRQAIDATLSKESLKEHARSNKELAQALEHFGKQHPV
ncbi:type III ribulose-bisphosphate carboxylase [Candidatus Pacearchaeota archaeon]|nr:type III ribulose-bisphosphate carboxylase [Candidatus Pacearchaeota archaeon]|tara:strand:- start:12288 stop:13535 length:1248 start_codon:yes stop_codon:yes gene_type:complete